MNLTRLLPLLLLSGCAQGLLGGLSAVDTGAYLDGRSDYLQSRSDPTVTYAKGRVDPAHDAHPPAPRYPHDTWFLVGGKVYTYEDLGFKDADAYDKWHDRTDSYSSDFSADEYRSSAYRYVKSGKRGSVSRRISEYQHREE